MRVTGISLAMLDISPEYAEEFNRWYDLDHMPEHLTRTNVIFGRRYVATPQLQALPGIRSGEAPPGHPPYLTIHSFGGPVDFTSDQGRADLERTDRAIIKAGRYWRRGQSVYNSHWRFAAAQSRSSVHVSEAAIPHLPHVGIVVAIGQAASPERLAEASAWWDTTQAGDIHDIPGVLATVRYSAADPDKPGQLLHLLLCHHPVGEVMADLTRVRRVQESVGRYPAHGGVYETLALLPYQAIVPLEHS